MIVDSPTDRCFRPTMRAKAMAIDDDSNGNPAPIFESDWRIQSTTPIAPNRAYPFGPCSPCRDPSSRAIIIEEDVH